MINATISGDIISSAALTPQERSSLMEEIKGGFNLIKEKICSYEDDFYGRIVRGDTVECYIKKPKDALRIALILKTLVGAFVISNDSNVSILERKRRSLFQNYGIRLSIALGEMEHTDIKQGILDGEAIYRSGRKLDEQKTSYKEKIAVKRTLFWSAFDSENFSAIEVIIGLIDTLIMEMTAKQQAVVYYKLLGHNESEISRILKISQSTVNHHSTSAGWSAIEEAILYYEHTTK
jgi:hypothetical protein